MPISLQQAQTLIQLMKMKGIIFEDGLTDDEIGRIQEQFDCIFPPDLAMLLQAALPVSHWFVPWREALQSQATADKITHWRNQPLEGMLFDIEYNEYWFEEWGVRPETLGERFAIATKHFHSYPKLIPIYSHRFIPSTPLEADNPVFSVSQMDIIYYGSNLPSYLAGEFHIDVPEEISLPAEPKHIQFWGDVIAISDALWSNGES